MADDGSRMIEDFPLGMVSHRALFLCRRGYLDICNAFIWLRRIALYNFVPEVTWPSAAYCNSSGIVLGTSTSRGKR